MLTEKVQRSATPHLTSPQDPEQTRLDMHGTPNNNNLVTVSLLLEEETTTQYGKISTSEGGEDS
jgi:hypothetical protein